MTTTITVTTKRQVVLPKAMRERKRIRPGIPLRITEVGEPWTEHRIRKTPQCFSSSLVPWFLLPTPESTDSLPGINGRHVRY